MISLQVAFSTILLVSLTSAFDSQYFISEYCRADGPSLFCSNVKLNSSEVNYIQLQDFVISDKEIVIFIGGNIGNVNGNFFKKFPNATKIIFDRVSLDLKSSECLGTAHRLEHLTFDTCVILGNMNTNALFSLEELTTLEIKNSKPEYKYLDSVFLERNEKLEVLKLMRSGFDNINRNALRSLGNLKIVHLTHMKITSLSWNTFEKNSNLIEINLFGNNLRKMPFRNTFPSSLEVLNLGKNDIWNLTKAKFIGLEKLKVLELMENTLRTLNENVFDSLHKLEVLSLYKNYLNNITKRHFKYLDKLREVDLALNYLTDVEINNFDEHIYNIFPQKF